MRWRARLSVKTGVVLADFVKASAKARLFSLFCKMYPEGSRCSGTGESVVVLTRHADIKIIIPRDDALMANGTSNTQKRNTNIMSLQIRSITFKISI